MNILITGAGGFIGKHLCSILSKRENNIYKIYSNLSSVNRKNSYEIDLTKGRAVGEIADDLSLKNIDVIIHLAAKMASPDNVEDLAIFEDNIAISKNLVYLTKKLKPKVLINFSSMAVYPNVSGLFSEKSLPSPQKNNDCIYGLSKYCSEVIFEYLLNKKNMRIVHLRLAQVYGKGMRKDRIIPNMRRQLEEKNSILVYGNGERVSNFIEINKLANYIDYFLNHDISGIYNIGDKNLSYYDLAKSLIEKYGNRDSTIKKIKKGSKEKFIFDSSKIQKLMDD